MGSLAVQLVASVNPLAELLDAETVAEDEISAAYNDEPDKTCGQHVDGLRNRER